MLARASAARSEPEAQEIWRTAVRLDPTAGTPLLGLAQGTDDRQRADLLVQSAVALQPSNPQVLKQAAAYWIQRGEADKAIGAWSAALTADPRERQAIFPLFLKLFEDERTRGLLAHYADRPPTWWDGYFQEVAESASDVETVRSLYVLRRTGSAVPLSDAERAAYVTRLRKEGMSTEAYIAWVNGLDDTHRRLLGLVNNGGFEADPVPNGWDWYLSPTKNLVIELAATHGADGRRALHLAFRGFDRDFRHVHQDLFLEPGTYRLTGMARPNGLKTSGGLKWAVECESRGRTTRIAETERFLGSSPWQPFDLRFEIPGDCGQPVLRLVGAVRVSGDRRIDGSLWFDTLRIQRLEAPPEQP